MIAAGFCAGAASWLATAMWARRRARDLERLGLDSEQWNSLATKDTLTGSGTRVIVFTDGLPEAYGGRGGLDIDEIGTITRAEGLGGLHTAC